MQCHYSADTDVGRGGFETTDNECLTVCLSCGMNGVTLSYCYPGPYFDGKNESLDVWE